jgi:hypothetical protein
MRNYHITAIMKWLETLAKLEYRVLTLILGVVLIILTCVSLNKEYYWTTHRPETLWLFVPGIALLLLSWGGYAVTLLSKRTKNASDIGAGLDLTRVKEGEGVLWTTVSGCEIRVVNGRVEEYPRDAGVAIVLPCNEYFDDRCADDTSSALGAYVNRVFEGQAQDFVSLMKDECRKKLGAGIEQQKTQEERAVSFGAGRCVLLTRPLGRATAVALVSTTTQRAGEGLAAQISYLFDGMCELRTRLADTHLREVAMPLLGAGHGRINPPLAFVGLLLAIAEAAYARYGQSAGQHLKRVTIIVFKRDADSAPDVDPIIVRRALALIASRD